MDVPSKNASERIEARLKELGLSKAEAARRGDFNRQTIYQLRTGAVRIATMTSETLTKIAKVLGVSADWIYDGTQTIDEKRFDDAMLKALEHRDTLTNEQIIELAKKNYRESTE